MAEAISDVCDPFGYALDVGCGLGFVRDRLIELGHPCVGWDFYAPEANRRVDLRAPVASSSKWSLVICTEVAEHLQEEFADRLVQTVTAHANNWIVWSAAPPGQPGTDHINLQLPEYWLQKFLDRGWHPNEERTWHLRDLMWRNRAQHMYCKDNFYVLEPV